MSTPHDSVDQRAIHDAYALWDNPANQTNAQYANFVARTPIEERVFKDQAKETSSKVKGESSLELVNQNAAKTLLLGVR